MALDRKAQEDMDSLFEDFLCFAERIERESSERLAQTGEMPFKGLLGVDRAHRRIAIVSLDRNAESEEGQR